LASGVLAPKSTDDANPKTTPCGKSRLLDPDTLTGSPLHRQSSHLIHMIYWAAR
jgi:hypothetical protein